MDLQNLLCEALILPKDEKEGSEVMQVRHEMDFKSPSQRMRAVIFLIWKHEHQDVPFETYYQEKMNSLIEWLKSKLPNAER